MKSISEKFSSYGRRWLDFIFIILDPINLLVLIAAILLYIFSISQTDLKIISILTIILSLLTSVLGGVYAKKWADIFEEKVITTRAKSANRSLQLLLENIITLERRISIYLNRINDKDNSEMSELVIRTYFEETLEKCLGLEQEVVNSIEDWKDILPDVDLKTVINLISELKQKFLSAQSELEKVNTELNETKNKTSDQITQLTQEKSTIESELDKIRRQLRAKSNEIGVPTISGSLITGGSILPPMPPLLKHYNVFENENIKASVASVANPLSKTDLSPKKIDETPEEKGTDQKQKKTH